MKARKAHSIRHAVYFEEKEVEVTATRGNLKLGWLRYRQNQKVAAISR